jgi:hypothetical protein
MSVVTKLYFQIVEEINYTFRPFPGWPIIRLRLEYRRKSRSTSHWDLESKMSVCGVRILVYCSVSWNMFQLCAGLFCLLLC